MQVAKGTPFERQILNRATHASMHFRLIGGKVAAAFFDVFLAFEPFFADVLRLVAIIRDSLDFLV
jgi:hypothetical protein